MAISEEKMRMVIKNYFKTECDINTTIKEAFEKGFRIGVQKGISAQPERKKGRWILSELQWKDEVDNGNYRFICSECGEGDLHSKEVTVPFCWNCGADMREEKTDERTYMA